MLWQKRNILFILVIILILTAADTLFSLFPYFHHHGSLRGYMASDNASNLLISAITNPLIAIALCYGNNVRKSRDEDKQTKLVKSSLAFAAAGAIALALVTYLFVF